MFTMCPRSTYHYLLSVESLSVVLALMIGCSKQPTRYPVAGKVLIDGQPVPKGSIQFVPEKGRPFAGKINENGTFRLAELSVEKDGRRSGVAPGKYQIGISSAEIVNEDSDEMLNHIPRKYADYRTSQLKVEIDSPREDMIIELTWEGSKERSAEMEEEATEDQPNIQLPADASSGLGSEPDQKEVVIE